MRIVATHSPGFGDRESPNSIRSDLYEWYGTGLRIRLFQWTGLLVGSRWLVRGWRMLVECPQSDERFPYRGCGTANALLSSVTTSAYALVREQFKVSNWQL